MYLFFSLSLSLYIYIFDLRLTSLETGKTSPAYPNPSFCDGPDPWIQYGRTSAAAAGASGALASNGQGLAAATGVPNPLVAHSAP